MIGLYEINIPTATSVMQSNNLYVYCANNSIIFVDRTGKNVYLLGGQIVAQLGIRLAGATGIVFDDNLNMGILYEISFGAGLDVGANVGGFFANIKADNITDINGGSFEIGGSISPIKLGPISFGAGYDMTFGMGEDEIKGEIYLLGGSISVLPVDGHGQISYTHVGQNLWTILLSLALKSIIQEES